MAASRTRADSARWISFPIAEETGQILPIGDWGLSEACNQIQAVERAEDPEQHSALRVCVNLSAHQFSREGLADHVEALLSADFGHIEPATRPGDDRVQPDF
jgi:EAL domain-containing protein (putative c-di-GMP-specific phosphodiesterase class I)